MGRRCWCRSKSDGAQRIRLGGVSHAHLGASQLLRPSSFLVYSSCLPNYLFAAYYLSIDCSQSSYERIMLLAHSCFSPIITCLFALRRYQSRIVYDTLFHVPYAFVTFRWRVPSMYSCIFGCFMMHGVLLIHGGVSHNWKAMRGRVSMIVLLGDLNKLQV
jgi:hypothetical protein